MKFAKRNIDIIIILIVGFALRFSISFTHSYSNDELSAINRLQFTSFSELIDQGVMKGDMHPAGIQVFMKAWSYVGGVNEIGMRFPFVLCGTASILLVFLIGLRWVNRSAGLIAAALLALLYFPIMNSEFARPYSPGLLFSLLSAFFYLRLLFSSTAKWRDAILLGVSMAAAMYIHYFAFMFIVWLGVSGLVFVKKTNIWMIISAGILAIILFVPHIEITQYHLGVGGLQWLAPPDADWLVQFLFHAFNESWWLISFLAAAIFLTFVLNGEAVVQNKKAVLLFCIWFFGIYMVGHIFSEMSTPVLKFPVMLFAMPFFLLLIGGILSKFRFQNSLLAVLMLLTALSTIRGKALFGNMHYELFREVAVDLVKWNEQYGADNVYTVYNLNNPNYMNFYAEQLGDAVDFDWDVLEFGDAFAVREDLIQRNEPFCVVGYSARLTLPQVFETCKEFYPFILDYKKYNNSAVFLLSKKGPALHGQNRALLTQFRPGLPNSWTYNPFKINLDTIPTNFYPDTLSHVYLLDSQNIYGPDFEFRIGEIENHLSKYIKVEVQAEIEAGGQLTAAVSGTRDGQQLMNRDEVFWLGTDLERMIETTGTSYFTFSIPAFIEPDDILKISCWNRDGNKIIKIRSIKVWVYDNIWN